MSGRRIAALAGAGALVLAVAGGGVARAAGTSEPRTLGEALAPLVVEGCGYALLPFGLAGLAGGLAGVPVDLSVASAVIGPVSNACITFPLPDEVTVCPNDEVPGAPVPVPPAQGRVIDLVEGAQTDLANPSVPDVAQQLRDQLGCSLVRY